MHCVDSVNRRRSKRPVNTIGSFFHCNTAAKTDLSRLFCRFLCCETSHGRFFFLLFLRTATWTVLLHCANLLNRQFSKRPDCSSLEDGLILKPSGLFFRLLEELCGSFLVLAPTTWKVLLYCTDLLNRLFETSCLVNRAFFDLKNRLQLVNTAPYHYRATISLLTRLFTNLQILLFGTATQVDLHCCRMIDYCCAW